MVFIFSSRTHNLTGKQPILAPIRATAYLHNAVCSPRCVKDMDNMLVSLIILISLDLIALFVYFKTTPKYIKARTESLYNYFIFAIAILACLTVYAYAYLNNGLSIERAMLSLLAYLQSLLVFSVVLIVGWLFRNCILFRRKK